MNELEKNELQERTWVALQKMKIVQDDSKSVIRWNMLTKLWISLATVKKPEPEIVVEEKPPVNELDMLFNE